MYSERDYTPAKDMGLKDDVPLEVKKRRINQLMNLQRQWAREENQKKIGRVYDVFGEGPSKKDASKQEGRSPQNQVVLAESGRDLKGRFYKVEITAATDAALYGKLA
jgi:tRNA-2-methylthio-N6-dimethylallyladenosine synthase